MPHRSTVQFKGAATGLAPALSVAEAALYV
jgi:hypothetical protein